MRITVKNVLPAVTSHVTTGENTYGHWHWPRAAMVFKYQGGLSPAHRIIPIISLTIPEYRNVLWERNREKNSNQGSATAWTPVGRIQYIRYCSFTLKNALHFTVWRLPVGVRHPWPLWARRHFIDPSSNVAVHNKFTMNRKFAILRKVATCKWGCEFYSLFDFNNY